MSKKKESVNYVERDKKSNNAAICMIIACIAVMICSLVPIAKLSIKNTKKNVTNAVNRTYGDGWGDIAGELWGEAISDVDIDEMNISLIDYDGKSAVGARMMIVAVAIIIFAANRRKKWCNNLNIILTVVLGGMIMALSGLPEIMAHNAAKNSLEYSLMLKTIEAMWGWTFAYKVINICGLVIFVCAIIMKRNRVTEEELQEPADSSESNSLVAQTTSTANQVPVWREDSYNSEKYNWVCDKCRGNNPFKAVYCGYCGAPKKP